MSILPAHGAGAPVVSEDPFKAALGGTQKHHHNDRIEENFPREISQAIIDFIVSQKLVMSERDKIEVIHILRATAKRLRANGHSLWDAVFW